MKFDTIIIGGGLSGLTAAITAAEHGQHVAIISSGQSALHFSSGSFELLGSVNGVHVTNPIDAIDLLHDNHPYRLIGREQMLNLLPLVQPMLTRAGVATTGNHFANRYRLTPLGKIKPAWITLDDFATFDRPDRIPWRNVAIVNIADFQDFFPTFIARGLREHGVESTIASTSIKEIDNLRKSSTEMRAATIARVLDYNAICSLAGRIKSVGRSADAILMPAIVGLYDDLLLRQLRRLVNKPLYFISTMPTSVPGVRTQMQLNRYFTNLGGIFMPGDTVTHAALKGNSIEAIFTINHGPEPLTANKFILASGSFISHGLAATPSRVIEPIFNLDVNFPTDRAQWFSKNINEAQPFMEFGVKIDENWHPSINGKTISNLQCVGSIIGGCNSIKEGSGAGVAMLSALAVSIKS